MQIWLLAVVGLLAGTAHAGTVSSVTFDGTAPTQIVVSNGVEARLVGGFVLYQHGAWAPPVVTKAVPGVAVPAAGVEDSTTTESCTDRPASSRRGLTSSTVAARLAYWPLIRAAECRHALPAGLLDAVVLQESRYRPFEVSSAGAGGLTQLMPRTANDLGVIDRFDPAANVDGGARYLRSMLDHYRSVPLALAAYNAGRGAVDRWGGIPLNRETPGYVRKVLGYYNEAATISATFLPTLVSHAVSLSFGSFDED